ncbi:hypothetical protein PSPO01_13303 [Paraphaeosphaeria sporulosa]
MRRYAPRRTRRLASRVQHCCAFLDAYLGHQFTAGLQLGRARAASAAPAPSLGCARGFAPPSPMVRRAWRWTLQHDPRVGPTLLIARGPWTMVLDLAILRARAAALAHLTLIEQHLIRWAQDFRTCAPSKSATECPFVAPYRPSRVPTVCNAKSHPTHTYHLFCGQPCNFTPIELLAAPASFP